MSAKSHSKTYKQINGCANKVLLNVSNQQKFYSYTKKKNERMGYYSILYWVAVCSLVYWFYREIKL